MDGKIFNYKGNLYPEYIRHGKAHSFVEPYAKFFCIGKGYDIGGEVGGNGHLIDAILILMMNMMLSIYQKVKLILYIVHTALSI